MSFLSEKDTETLERIAEVLEKIQLFAKPVSTWEELAQDELRLPGFSREISKLLKS